MSKNASITVAWKVSQKRSDSKWGDRAKSRVALIVDERIVLNHEKEVRHIKWAKDRPKLKAKQLMFFFSSSEHLRWYKRADKIGYAFADIQT